jgi:ectoine hydroxylase-related dioxygenase (phytanoyl-CoA dioxygenase family)
MNDTTLPPLDSFIQIPESQVEAFRKNGHTLIRNIVSPGELAPYRKAILEAAENFNTEKRKMEDRDTYGKAFLQIMNLWTKNEDVKKFVIAKRFGKIAADLLGVKNVRIYHDQALFKEAGGGPTPWHQDQYYWPLDTHNTVTMWMPLVDIDVEMGMLTFASGSYHAGFALNKEISDESGQEFDDIVAEKKYPVTLAKQMKAGDATWHYGYTIHKAPQNFSAKLREVMTIIYVADGAKIIQPQNEWQENDHKTWLMSKQVGSIAGSELNPLVL